MTTPNILAISSIVGKTAVVQADTTMQTIIANEPGSNKSIKVNTLQVANYNSMTISTFVDIYRSNTSYIYAGGTPVPYNSVLILCGKDTTFYLEEGDSLRANVTSNTSGTIMASYEIIS